MLDEPGTMVNAVGVPNPGVTAWAEQTLPAMVRAGVTVVASVWGVDPDGVIGAAELLAPHRGPVAWEVNLSCPNSGHASAPVSHDPEAAATVCRAVRALAPDEVGVWAKLSPDAPDVPAVAAACRAAGADAVTVSNTFPAAALDVRPATPLGGGTGGMSGGALRPRVRRLVGALREQHPDVPVIACGGVLGTADAVGYLDLGAVAVQVGTASLYDPRACHKIARGVVAARTR
jgi:dihydroorotate dehydrogenase (NAD+) catalytic subunit